MRRLMAMRVKHDFFGDWGRGSGYRSESLQVDQGPSIDVRVFADWSQATFWWWVAEFTPCLSWHSKSSCDFEPKRIAQWDVIDGTVKIQGHEENGKNRGLISIPIATLYHGRAEVKSDCYY